MDGYTGTNAKVTTVATDIDGDGLVGNCDLDDDGDGNPDELDINSETPTATDDSATTPNNTAVSVNILINDDYLPNNDSNNLGTTVITDLGTGTATGTISFDNDTGELIYTPSSKDEIGDVTIDYKVCNDIAPAGEGIEDICATATVTITIEDIDSDEDGIGDSVDLDDDNDGILDTEEGDDTIDTDGDTIPDYLDPDSDNDGCPDVVEAGFTESSTKTGELEGTGYDNDGLVKGGIDGYTVVNDKNNNSIKDYKEVGDFEEILSQPESKSAIEGETVQFKVEVTNESNLKFSWEHSTDSGSTWNKLVDDDTYKGTSTSQLTITSVQLLMDAEKFKVLIENEAYLCDVPEYSSIVGLSVSLFVDTDGDGIDDPTDLDDDNDGILDTEEGDGSIDTDGDTIPDSLDPDSDNDGCPDVVEAGFTESSSKSSELEGTGYDSDGLVTGGSDGYTGTNTDVTTEATDIDRDGLVGNCDLDDDGDGNPDELDVNSETPIAVDDSTTTPNNTPVTVNILTNDDYLPNNDSNNLGTTVITDLGTGTATGIISFDNDTGELTYTPQSEDEVGDVTIDYKVCNDIAPSGVGIEDICATATVTITIGDKTPDTDGDGIDDITDLDDDNDGILDTEEGDGSIDTDGDTIPDSLDPDSDNDGCPDVVEAGFTESSSKSEELEGTGYSSDGLVIGGSDGYTGTNSEVTTEGIDIDGDGLMAACDLDDDGDGNPDVSDPNTGNPIALDDYKEVNKGEVVKIDIINNDDYLPNLDLNSLGSIYITNLGTGTEQGTFEFDFDTGEIIYTPTEFEEGFVTIDYQVCNDLAPIGEGAEDVCARAVITIKILAEEFEIFNAVTPNDDGAHDYFEIKGIQNYPNNSVQIFNRWGVLVLKRLTTVAILEEKMFLKENLKEG